jgi:hypothetical protein
MKLFRRLSGRLCASLLEYLLSESGLDNAALKTIFIVLLFVLAYSLLSYRNYRLARQPVHNLPQEQSDQYQANENLCFSNRAYMAGHRLREIFDRSFPML